MRIQYDIFGLSLSLKQSEPGLWAKLGWILSDLESLPEEKYKEKYLCLITKATVFLRTGSFGISVRDEVWVAVEIAKQSCFERESQ